jgi:hypothetical protein
MPMQCNFSRYLVPLILFSMVMICMARPSAGQETNVCVQCHSSLPGRLGEPVKLWKGSIHAANGIYCNECHGGDPRDAANAMSPQRGFIGVPKETAIPGVCGRCHVGVRRDYLNSAHGRALGKGGPTCVTCHSNHAVLKASLNLINPQSCGRCHDYGRAGEIREAMLRTEEHILAVEAGIGRFKRQGADTDRMEKALFASRNRFHTLFHDVDVERVKAEAGGIDAELKTLDDSLQGIADEHLKRKITGVFLVAGALLAALFFHLLRKTYE